MSRESHKTATKKDDNPDGDDSNSDLRPKFPCNNRKPNPGKDKQQKTTINHDTQRYCVLWKKAWYSNSSYKSHYSKQCNEFDSAKTNKYLDGVQPKTSPVLHAISFE